MSMLTKVAILYGYCKYAEYCTVQVEKVTDPLAYFNRQIKEYEANPKGKIASGVLSSMASAGKDFLMQSVRGVFA